MRKIKTLSLISIVISSFPVFSQNTTIQNEISVGFSDLRSSSDIFVGINYTHYLEEVQIDQQPWAISPYLQRSDKIQASYFGIDDFDRYGVSGDWYLSDNWVLRGRYVYTNNEFSNKQHQLGIDVSQFVSQHWEIGAGLDYFNLKRESGFSGDETETDVAFKVFARYTSFDPNMSTFSRGWDIRLTGVVEEDDSSISLVTDYYLQRNWSIGLDIISQNDRGSFSSGSNTTTIAEIGTEYWFNPHSSIRFGLGVDVEESTLGSATLLGTFRF